MKIPNLPLEPFSLPGGEVNPTWKFWFEQVATTLQKNLDEGFTIPAFSATDIATLSTTESIGRIIYNTTTQRMMQNLSGTYVNIGL